MTRHTANSRVTRGRRSPPNLSGTITNFAQSRINYEQPRSLLSPRYRDRMWARVLLFRALRLP